MIWQNPWAWLGLATLAVPILIHLLGRGRARVLRFPSLRFITPSRLLPTRRTRLHDPLLLAVRLGILGAAVAALAQPLLLTARRAESRNRALARVVIVDTSASMRRASSAGSSAVNVARARAKLLADSAQSSVTLESAAPAAMIPGAVAWLSRQVARREIVVVSDFQRGTLAEAELKVVPRATGVRLVRVPIEVDSSILKTRARFGETVVTARTTPTAAGTTVEWTSSRAADERNTVQLLAGADERNAVDAASHAASTLGVSLPLDTTYTIAIVFPRFEQRGDLVRAAEPPRYVWMTEVLARLRADSLLATAAAAAVVATTVPLDSAPTGRIVVVRNNDGVPVVFAAQAGETGRERLLLFSSADAGTVTSAALILAANRAVSLAPAAGELDRGMIADSLIAAWQRAPATEAPRENVNGHENASDGRWLWLIALILLGIESWLRRAPSQLVDGPTDSIADNGHFPSSRHDRVA